MTSMLPIILPPTPILYNSIPIAHIAHPNHTSGIGRATAISFTLEGCGQIVISDINLTSLHETEKYMREVSSDVDILVNQVDMQEEA
jgi:hypothetical protein